jgi:hypothetical protein
VKYLAIISLVAALLFVCGSRLGEALSQQVTDFSYKPSRGPDGSMSMVVPVSMTPQVQALGLTNTISKPIGIVTTNGIAIYFIASHSISNTLVARAVNASGVEIGRTKKLVVMQKDDHYYVNFDFDEQTDVWQLRACDVRL